MAQEKLFEQVAQAIYQRVQDGVYVSSQKLPSEYDLAEEFQVSRLTVRRAISELIKRNVLIKQKGKGTYILPQEKIQSGSKGLQGFTEVAKEQGKAPDTQVVLFEKKANIPNHIAKELELNYGDYVYHIIRIRSLDNEPMTMENLYIKECFMRNISEESASHSLFDQIEENISIAYSNQEIEALLATDELAERLTVSTGSALLKVNSVVYSITSVPIMYDESYYRGDKYTFKNILYRNSQ